MNESVRDMLAREAADAEARAEAEERGDVPAAPGQRGRRRASDPSQVYSVRIPVSRLRELRHIADELGTPPTALIRQWVLDRLDQVAASGPPAGTEAKASQGLVNLGRRRQRDHEGLLARAESDRERRYA